MEEDNNIDTQRLKELQDIKIMNSKGVCPTCHQVIALQEFDESELQSLLNSRNTTTTKMTSINKAIQQLTTSLRIQEAKRVAVMEVHKDVHNDSREVRENLQTNIDIINNTLKIIAQGTVHQVYLNQFLRTLNNNLLSNQKGNYKIRALLDNSSITYKIQTDSQDKYIEQLSGGESTTISLIILVSIFKTLKQLLNIDLNLLILDEAIHMVDSNNKEFISEIIKSMDKNVIVVQHEDNIDPKIFNNSMEVVKEGGLATIKDIS
jgi:ATPase subunit of ABC transporter with duplicated ATPase domains